MNTMEFEDDAWSWMEESTTLEEQDIYLGEQDGLY